jgi:formimidoylglutamate deiminase
MRATCARRHRAAFAARRAEDAMRACWPARVRELPIHIHIAEQIGEVQDCLALRGARPVEWLFDHAGGRALVPGACHASDRSETAQPRAQRCGRGLCPTTEANLGDGLFPLAGYLDARHARHRLGFAHLDLAGGRTALAGIRPAPDHGHRNIAARGQGVSVGETLWQAALQGGAQASGLPIGELHDGARADLIVLDESSPLLAARDSVRAGQLFVRRQHTAGARRDVRWRMGGAPFSSSRRGAHCRALSRQCYAARSGIGRLIAE